MRIIGLDVCKDSVVACMIDGAQKPAEPRQLYYDAEFPRFKADLQGIKTLLALTPDVAVMEPTGVNYMKLWATRLAEAGIEIALVGHRQLRSYRQSLDLPDKDDAADALALASYYLEHRHRPRRFLRKRDPIIAQIRDLVLRLSHLNRVQSPIVNRVRQDLAWQFPEVQSCSLSAALFWGWLAAERRSSRYDRLHESSVGLGLKAETRNAARAICDLQRRERALELEIRCLMKDPRFQNYRRVFASFGFGERVEALILSQIYPLSNYLDDNNKPEIRICKGKNSGKDTRRYLSRRRFQKALGVAPTREESGDSRATKKAGSSLCRMSLWQWLFTRIEPPRRRLKTPIGKRLGDLLDEEKQHKPVKLARSRVMAKAADLLFRELVKGVTD